MALMKFDCKSHIVHFWTKVMSHIKYIKNGIPCLVQTLEACGKLHRPRVDREEHSLFHEHDGVEDSE